MDWKVTFPLTTLVSQDRWTMLVFLDRLDLNLSCVTLALQVNGNLVSPMHVLANAEVVEIITYNVSCDFELS